MNSLPPYALTRHGVMQRRIGNPHSGPPRDPSHMAGAMEFADLLPKDAVVVGRTAALLHGLDVLPPGRAAATWPVEISVPRNWAGLAAPTVRIYRWAIASGDVTTVADMPVTTLERTAADCARCLPRLEAVAALDQFLRMGVEARRLLLRADTRTRYGRRIAAVLDAADSGAESPGEGWTRCLIVDAGLPRPCSQVPVGLAGGRVFLDLGYEEYRQGVEYYGAEFHTRVHRSHDAARVAALTGLGWDVFVVRAADVVVKPDALLRGLLSRLRCRGWAPAPSHEKKVRKRIGYICMMLRHQRRARV
ncbi:hypothetical protein FZ103_04370 [Streptomonospora sp. PA3]|uniref:hypothetical protein n=1 Tax=Streptomonospora sp. PA3 TaxID=2607326 RepID=UPI0012DEECB9|nr:hypothetical protein [Streptomonospora sp. PA3]MUL40420.1 hypothetical protein [Streptomonospora sp. PA3]